MLSSSCGGRFFEDFSPSSHWRLTEKSGDQPETAAASTGCDRDESASVPNELQITSLPLATKLTVASAHRAWTGLLALLVENRGATSMQFTTAEVEFLNACEVIDSVAFLVDGAVVSDSACAERVNFTLDTEVIGQTNAFFEIQMLARNDIDGLMSAFRREKSHQTFTITLAKINEGRRGALPISIQSAPIEIVFPTCRERTDTDDSVRCFETEDAGSFTIDLCRDESIRVARNDNFFLPFHAWVSALGDLPTLGDIPIAFEVRTSSILEIIPSALIVNGSISRSRVSGGADQRLRLALAEEELLAGTSNYAILARAPNFRGALTLALEAGDVGMSNNLTLAGCYPQTSETILILPPEEWDEIMSER